jgi:sugar lactone lactonase YvrE
VEKHSDRNGDPFEHATHVTYTLIGGRVIFDRAGNLYVVDFGNRRIRKIARDGTISTYAGNGQVGSGGDGSAGT